MRPPGRQSFILFILRVLLVEQLLHFRGRLAAFAIRPTVEPALAVIEKRLKEPKQKTMTSS